MNNNLVKQNLIQLLLILVIKEYYKMLEESG